MPNDKLNSGFTLIEVIVVTLVIGILSAIAVPSWLGFVNRQRISTVNESILRTLQTAQQEARKQKISYSVSFRTNNQIPQVAIYSRGTTPSNTDWKSIAEDININPQQILLRTNLNGDSQVNTNPDVAATEQTISFDFRGNLPRDASFSETNPLIVTVALPRPNNATQPLAGTSRCVVVRTLLGAMQTGREDQCNF